MRPDKLIALKRALGWLRAHCLEVLPRKPSMVALIKRISEAAMLAGTLLRDEVRALDPELAEHAEGWLDVGWRVLRGGDFFAESIALDPRWVELALPYAYFARRGRRNPRLEELLREHRDRIHGSPFLRLGVACGYQQLGIPSGLDIDELLREQWITRTSDAWLPDVADSYEVTHVVFWLGDMDRIPAALAARIVTHAPVWIDHYQRARNVDLAAELVLMMHYLRAPVAPELWSWLLESQEEDGSLPGIELPTPAIGRFHPTLVTAMALAICAGGACCDCE